VLESYDDLETNDEMVVEIKEKRSGKEAPYLEASGQSDR
jgi:hypothetical protein